MALITWHTFQMERVVKYARMFMDKTGWYALPIFGISIPLAHKADRWNAEALGYCKNKTELFGGKKLNEGEELWR